MPRRALIVLAAALVLALAFAAPALAGHNDNGEGLLGEANDKVITFWGMMLIFFFPAVALVGTAIQTRLERRKERKK